MQTAYLRSLNFRKTQGSIPIFPFSAFFHSVNALKTLKNVSLRCDLARGLQTRVL